ncbi:MAG: peptidase M20, partial [Candidatus Dormibacteraeota bacterium]|nr:peptidase M20 [Candidatus Dormibacteraeota bacterium]
MSERFAAIDRHLAQQMGDRVAELSVLCRVPSVSARHEGVDECAVLVADLLAGRGFSAEVISSDGHPIV